MWIASSHNDNRTNPEPPDISARPIVMRSPASAARRTARLADHDHADSTAWQTSTTAYAARPNRCQSSAKPTAISGAPAAVVTAWTVRRPRQLRMS